MIRGTLLEPLVWWIYSAIAVTGVCGCVYLAVQQNYRLSANDPQIQIAEDGAVKLSAGGVPADLVDRSSVPIDIKTSLDTWVAVYDTSGTPLEASAQLNGLPPQPPKSLFDSADWTEPKTFHVPSGLETRVTWQPQSDVREAIVLAKASNGYTVVAGRSLRLTEDRVTELTTNMFIGWVATLGALFIASFAGWLLLTGKKNIVQIH